MTLTVGAVHEPTVLEQLPTTPPELDPLLLLVAPEELVPEALLLPELVVPELPELPPPLEPAAPEPLLLALVEPPLVPPDADPELPPELVVWPPSVPPQVATGADVPQPAQTATIEKTEALRQPRAGAAGRVATLSLAICTACPFAVLPRRR